jgi:predicted DNA-binding transcriptional regulator AlpA
VNDQRSPSVTRDRLISERTTAEILGISRDTLRRLGQRGEGPRRRKISPRRVGYKISEVEAYRDGAGPQTSALLVLQRQSTRRQPMRRQSRARS